MKIQTTDRCNKKSSSFTNARILSSKDNLTPQLQRIKKAFHRVTLLLKRLISHNLPVHVVTKILAKMTKIPGFWTTTLPVLQMLIILFTNPAAY